MPSSIYPGKPDPSLERKITTLMAEIRKKHPDPTLRDKVRRIPKNWFLTVRRPGLALRPLGLAALPYVEEMTKSKGPKEREIAYEMLQDFSANGKSRNMMSIDEYEANCKLLERYVYPIWERGLYDSSEEVRWMSIRHANHRYLGSRGIKIYRRMLRDPYESTRFKASWELSSYGRPDLVPIALRRKAERSGIH
jgi:hypothetical protein